MRIPLRRVQPERLQRLLTRGGTSVNQDRIICVLFEQIISNNQQITTALFAIICGLFVVYSRLFADYCRIFCRLLFVSYLRLFADYL